MHGRRSIHRRSGRFLPFLGIALFIHNFIILAGFAYWVAWGRQEAALREARDQDSMDVSLLDNAGDEEAVRSLARDLKDTAKPDEEKQKTEEEKKEDESVKAPGQVVEVAPPAEEKVPEKSRFVSEYNTSVEKETKARTNGKPGAGPGPKAEAVQPAPPPAPKPEAEKEQPPQTPGPLAMRSVGSEKREGARADKIDRQRGAQEEAPDGLLERAPDGQAADPGATPHGAAPGGPAGGGRLSMEKLMPSDKQLLRSIGGGGGGTNDYLKDIDEGDDTALNSKRWKFASFFNRIKRAVADHWRPDVEYRRRDPSGNVYGLRDRITVLRVSLKPDGSLAGVLVEQPCGVDFLDDEAITAFREAQPFPNPPRQLIDESGTIQFRFAFIFEISSTPTFKIFRYN
jgi:TonB family protein